MSAQPRRTNPRMATSLGGNGFDAAKRFGPVLTIGRIEDLEPYLDAIDELAQDAVHPNPFYEPWFLLPLAKTFGGRRLCFVLVHDSANSRDPSRLIGFFPFERAAFHPYFPLPCLRMWQDSNGWIARHTPLVRAGMVDACLAHLTDWWIGDPRRPALMDLGKLPGGTEISRHIERHFEENGRLHHFTITDESHLYRRLADAETYLKAAMSSKRRGDFRRCLRRLEELGPVRFVDIDDYDDAEPLVDEFLALEARGWKGDQGTAMALTAGGGDAKAILMEAYRRDRLSLLGLRVADTLVAARCVLLGRPGSFGFKIAYDERPEYARSAPGFLVEIEGIRRLHQDMDRLGCGMRWLDTCSAQRSTLPRSLRSEALPVQRFIVAVHGGAAAWAMTLLLRLRRYRHTFNMRRKEAVERS